MLATKENQSSIKVYYYQRRYTLDLHYQYLSEEWIKGLLDLFGTVCKDVMVYNYKTEQRIIVEDFPIRLNKLIDQIKLFCKDNKIKIEVLKT